jgi:hypothetical protein
VPKPRFLIYCPIGVKTGGPECLYQLCDAINQLGFESLIVPSIDTVHLIPCPDFEKYKVKYLENCKIYPQDVLIIPEVSNRIPKWLSKSILPSNLVLWWLSVDNSPLESFKNYELQNYQINSCWKQEDASLSKLKNPIRMKRYFELWSQLKSWIFNIRIFLVTSRVDLDSSVHFAQSEYARMVVSKNLGSRVGLLTDYVYGSECQILPVRKITTARKRVAYNPFKGSELMQTFVSLFDGELEFIELRNMNSAQVVQTLQESDLYLDLGHFPGKDRIPREAILAGCPVFLASRGAARNTLDFNLHTDFKVDLTVTTPKELKRRIVNQLKDGDLFGKQLEFFNQQRNSREVFFSEVRAFVDSYPLGEFEEEKEHA